MRTEFLQKKLLEIVSLFGESTFDFIDRKVFEKHVYENKPFTNHQLEAFGNFVTQLKRSLEDEEEEVLKETAKTGFDAARELMKENGLKELKLGKFGIYRQYEMSGERVSFYLLDDIDPEIVKEVINSDETGLVRAIFENKLHETEEELFPNGLPNNYAEHAGRPNLDKLPMWRSENDGYPFLPGHDPLCNGKAYHKGMCKCKYDKWNMRNGISESEMWPGGPSVDDFDM